MGETKEVRRLYMKVMNSDERRAIDTVCRKAGRVNVLEKISNDTVNSEELFVSVLQGQLRDLINANLTEAEAQQAVHVAQQTQTSQLLANSGDGTSVFLFSSNM